MQRVAEFFLLNRYPHWVPPNELDRPAQKGSEIFANPSAKYFEPTSLR